MKYSRITRFLTTFIKQDTFAVEFKQWSFNNSS